MQAYLQRAGFTEEDYAVEVPDYVELNALVQRELNQGRNAIYAAARAMIAAEKAAQSSNAPASACSSINFRAV